MELRLPIDPHLEAIRQLLSTHQAIVIQAPPGAGKTLRVPLLALSVVRGQVLVSEPRRLAARLAARMAARLRGCSLGAEVGYQVRFDTAGGPWTRLWFLTDGVLVLRLIHELTLPGVDVVILDEFHERRLQTDLCLALLRVAQERRRDLKLVVMSATMDAEPLAAYLGNCPIVRIETRQYPIEITHWPYSPLPLEQRVAEAFSRLLSYGMTGDVLVFLPGAAEIRRAAKACSELAKQAGYEITPLHGSLPPEAQDRAVMPGPLPKLILSTNVAESSITIEGVRTVIDSGLARVPYDSPERGLPSLVVSRISQASATQRAGRAARSGPGRVIRLYPLEDYLRRPAFEPPEILRRDLSALLLQVYAAGFSDPYELEWLAKPPQAAVDAAQELLERLGALDSCRRLTVQGAEMARLPVHPRLARLLIEARGRGVARWGCALAALLETLEAPRIPHPSVASSDLLVLLDEPWPESARPIFQQLCQLMHVPPRLPSADSPEIDRQLRIATLAAFPDRVALRRKQDELLLAGGSPARLAPTSTVRKAKWLVAIDVEQRNPNEPPEVRLASAIEPEWLVDLFPSFVRERKQLVWNPALMRVEEQSALCYGALPIVESRKPAPAAPEASAVLAERAIAASWSAFVEEREVRQLLGRLEFAARHGAVRSLTPQDLEQALRELCEGKTSFAELRAACARGKFEHVVLARLNPIERRQLEEIAPEWVRVPSGRRLRLDYSLGEAPRLRAQLQDLFGLTESPRVGLGRVPVVVELLAPNQRPVQITSDLSNFWRTVYPRLRPQLARRYPKHRWPEDPLTTER